MSRQTHGLESGLVDIVRDLLVANRMTRDLFGRYRKGELSFAEVQELVGDTDDSLLFRLKERSHALFRQARGDSDVTMRREALFDLAVGSLFHEAMKFRENFYQRFVYGPKVRELRGSVDPEGAALLQEFEKILEASSVRLDEALQEAETLLSQTTAQLRVLLVDHRGNGLVARYLLRNAALVEQVFGQDLDSLLAEIYGSAAEAYELAGRSLLTSGYFDEARPALETALARGGKSADLTRLIAYADGMSAYLAGHYSEALDQLGDWLDADPPPEESPFAALAHAALERVPQLVEGAESQPLSQAASRLAARMQRLAAGTADSAGTRRG